MNCLLCNNDTNEIITNTLRDGSKANVYWCPKCELGFINSEKK